MDYKPKYKPSNPKIDVHIDGLYISSTCWYKRCKDVKKVFREKFPNSKIVCSIDHTNR